MHSTLVFDGRPSDRIVLGVELRAQFSYGEWWLLLLEGASGFFGELYLQLLGTSLEVMDQRELGVTWSPPAFVTDLTIAAPDALEFGFFGNDLWRLTILPAPKLMCADWARRETRQWDRLLSRRWLALDDIRCR